MEHCVSIFVIGFLLSCKGADSISNFQARYDSSQPMTEFNLPEPTATPGLLGFENLTMDQIINSKPTGGGSCSQNSPPSNGRQAVNPNSIWNQGYINFQIDPQFTESENQLIQNGMVQIRNILSGCLSVGLWPSNAFATGDYVYISSYVGSGCWSKIGKVGGRQMLYLERHSDPNKSCLYIGTAIHEMTHALGFYHEHVRRDRDQFVNIYLDNVIPKEKYNFDIQYAATLYTPYDYYSIMHYYEYTFTANGQRTVQAKQNGIIVGQRDYPTDSDRKKIRALYKCQ